MSEPNSIVGTAGDALVVGNTFELYDEGMHLVIQLDPVHIYLYNKKEDKTFHVALDKAEAKFLGKFLLGER